MTDRELLERAAHAIGIELIWSTEPDLSPRDAKTFDYWDPRYVDSHAFQLAVALSLFDKIERKASEIAGAVDFDMDPCEAARRAITVLAAAMAPEVTV